MKKIINYILLLFFMSSCFIKNKSNVGDDITMLYLPYNETLKSDCIYIPNKNIYEIFNFIPEKYEYITLYLINEGACLKVERVVLVENRINKGLEVYGSLANEDSLSLNLQESQKWLSNIKLECIHQISNDSLHQRAYNVINYSHGLNVSGVNFKLTRSMYNEMNKSKLSDTSYVFTLPQVEVFKNKKTSYIYMSEREISIDEFIYRRIYYKDFRNIYRLLNN
jgi:hypothetical protein